MCHYFYYYFHFPICLLIRMHLSIKKPNRNSIRILVIRFELNMIIHIETNCILLFFVLRYKLNGPYFRWYCAIMTAEPHNWLLKILYEINKWWTYKVQTLHSNAIWVVKARMRWLIHCETNGCNKVMMHLCCLNYHTLFIMETYCNNSKSVLVVYAIELNIWRALFWQIPNLS